MRSTHGTPVRPDARGRRDGQESLCTFGYADSCIEVSSNFSHYFASTFPVSCYNYRLFVRYAKHKINNLTVLIRFYLVLHSKLQLGTLTTDAIGSRRLTRPSVPGKARGRQLLGETFEEARPHREDVLLHDVRLN